MDLIVTMASESPTLMIIGEIYASPVLPNEPPKVSDVIASNGKISHFNLSTGAYEYRFHVASGIGKLSVKVRHHDGQVLSADDFDTKFGFHGKVLAFGVP